MIFFFSQFFFPQGKKSWTNTEQTIWTILRHTDFVKTKALCCGPVKIVYNKHFEKRNIWIIMNTNEKKQKYKLLLFFLLKSLCTHQEKKNLMTLKNRLKSIQTSTKHKQKRIWFCIDTPSVDLYYVAEPAIFIYTGNRDHDIVWFTA